MFRFENIYILFLLALIPVLYIGFFIYQKNLKRRMEAFASSPMMDQLMPEYSRAKAVLKFNILIMALLFIIVALARPQFGSKLREVKRKGIEMIVALDVSNSMMATDISPNRLERSKQAITTLMGKMKDDLIGMIVFAGEAYTQLPITTDYASARMFLSNITTDIVARQGTAIGEAIDLGRRSFTQNEASAKVIVIISDGENHEGNAVEAAKLANQEGITIYTIGMGSVDGSLIPKKSGSGFISDRQGNPVTTRMNADMLNQIAVNGGGSFYQASTSNVGLNKLYNELKKIEKAELETKVYSEYDDQYTYLIIAALLLIVADLFLMNKKNKKLSQIKMFE